MYEKGYTKQRDIINDSVAWLSGLVIDLLRPSTDGRHDVLTERSNTYEES